MSLLRYKAQNIGILGLGSTGLSVFAALHGIAQILCWDDSEKQRQSFAQLYAQEYLTEVSDTAWQNLALIIVSPGIPAHHHVFILAKTFNIPVSSDIQIFLEQNPQAKIIAVTGTNGKSTTTSLIGHILNCNQLNWYVGGNIGLPVLNLPHGAGGYVLEMSSFQLSLLENFNPDVAILLNITPDHLDRHGNFMQYCEAKLKILNGQGFKIIGTDDIILAPIYQKFAATQDKIVAISEHECFGIRCLDSYITDKFFTQHTYELPPSLHLQGKHNNQNKAAAFAACVAIGLAPREIIPYMSSFAGLPHRMQYLGTKNKLSYYNDSKATNTSSALCSLSTLRNIYWLAGGIFKEDNLLAINDVLPNIHKAYLFGQDKMLFAQYLQDNHVDYAVCATMHEAFVQAKEEATTNQIAASILLAPACASFDQFKNFEDRGQQFITLYQETAL